MSPDFEGEVSVSISTVELATPCIVQSVKDPSLWDEQLARMGGQVHQSWKWGEFRRSRGWNVERILAMSVDGQAMAQVLSKPHGPMSTAFIARGPLVDGDGLRLIPALWDRALEWCRHQRAVNIVVDPLVPIPMPPGLPRDRILPPTTQFSPVRSVVVQLEDDNRLISQMHSSKRREIRRAGRSGITIEDHGPDGVGYAAYYEIARETAERNRIRIEEPDYYADFLRIFGDDAVLKLAVANGKVAAGLIVAKAGDEATYLYGASSTQHRLLGATALLQLSAMQWARDSGCARYDLWGIPATDPVSYIGPDNKPIRSIGEDDSGLYRFKVGFGGDIVSYPASFDIRMRPLLWRTATYLKGLRRAIKT